MKVKGLTDQTGQRTMMVFWCPGCKQVHPYRIARSPGEEGYPVWSFNGDQERPTFSPSLVVHEYKFPDGTIQQPHCHLFLTDGMLQFCADSRHELAGKTVPCPDWDDERW